MAACRGNRSDGKRAGDSDVSLSPGDRPREALVGEGTGPDGEFVHSNSRIGWLHTLMHVIRGTPAVRDAIYASSDDDDATSTMLFEVETLEREARLALEAEFGSLPGMGRKP